MTIPDNTSIPWPWMKLKEIVDVMAKIFIMGILSGTTIWMRESLTRGVNKARRHDNEI